MIEFVWPWAFFLAPLPLLARRLLPAAAPRRQASLRVPDLQDFRLGEDAGRGRLRRGPLLLAALGWLALVTAVARPEWLGETVDLPASARDLMLAVDLSRSMQERDFELAGQRVDRLSATKAVAREFIERRAGDRLGLVLFGEQAYLQTPLTFDHETLGQLLDEAAIGLAGQATAIGDAIGLAVKRLREQPAASRVLILITDGANTAGEVDPRQAAELAAREGLTIYTIGIGADSVLVRDIFGTRRVNPSRDLDEDMLDAIAETTGGRYFRARDTEELRQIYALLDELEPLEREGQRFRPRHALFDWPLAFGLLCGALVIFGRLRGW
jgi:Ca-activated chloride channel family protein